MHYIRKRGRSMKKYLALMLVLAILVPFAACTKDPEGDTTTTTANNDTSSTNPNDPSGTNPTANTGDTTLDPSNTGTTVDTSTTTGVPPTDEQGNTVPTTVPPTNGPTETAAPTKEGDPPTKAPTAAPTQPPANVVPVNGSIAEIVDYYSKAANATKTSKDFSVKKHTVQTVKFVKPTIVAAFANTLLKDLDGKTLDYDITFKNGIGYDNKDGGKQTTRTPQSFLPIKDQDYMCKLPASGVKAASCVADGSNYKVVIELINETVKAVIEPPVYSSCMNSVTEDIKNVKEVKISDNAQAAYSQGKITAVVNSQGKLVSVSMHGYGYITGDVESGTVKIPLGGKVKNAELYGVFDESYNFTW